MKPTEAADVINLLLASYPTQRQRMSGADCAEMLRAYASALADLDVGVVRAAVSALVLTEQWIPTIATIRAKAAELTKGRTRSGGEAWGDVTEAMRRYGSHRAPGVEFEFRDPLVGQCVRRLGWRDLCASENAIADRAHFMKMYDALAADAARDRAVAGAIPASQRPELPAGTRPLGEAIANLLPRGGSS